MLEPRTLRSRILDLLGAYMGRDWRTLRSDTPLALPERLMDAMVLQIDYVMMCQPISRADDAPRVTDAQTVGDVLRAVGVGDE